jgi:succinate dehydrogenase / fumarate reductase, membrane anchor subunit
VDKDNAMTSRTPLAHVRGLGSAHSGTDHWWHQRVTAVANVPLALLLIWLGVAAAGSDHGSFVSLVRQPIVALGLILALLNHAWHMKLGMQVVIEDYVHSRPLNVGLLLGNLFFSAGVSLAGLFAVLKIVFGA